MCLVINRWTGSMAAGVIAGLLYAFNAHVLTRFPHVQAQHVEFFRSSSMRSIGSWRAQAVATPRCWPRRSSPGPVLQLPVGLLHIAVVAAAAVRPADWWAGTATRAHRAGARGRGNRVVLAPFLWPYYQLSRDQGLARQSARWRRTRPGGVTTW